MAKTTAAPSLLGRADTTLITAATKAAMANVPKSMAPIHRRVMAARGVGMRSMGQMFGKALEAAGQIGGKLLQESRQTKLSQAGSDSFGFKEDYQKPEGDSDTSAKPLDTFDDKKIGNFQKKIDELNSRSKDATGIEGLYKEEVTKLENKIKKRQEKLTKRYANEFVHVDSQGNDNVLQIKTVADQLKSVRTSIIKLRRSDNPNKKEEIQKLKNVRDNIRKSSVEFSAFGNVIDEKLNLDAIDVNASMYNDPNKVLFAQAIRLGVENKPLGEDAGDLAGARAITGFDKDGNMSLAFVDKFGKQVKGEDGEPITVDPKNMNNLFTTKNPTVTSSIDNALNVTANYADGKKGLTFEMTAVPRVKNVINNIKTNADFQSGAFHDETGNSLFKTLGGLADDKNGVTQFQDSELAQELFNISMEITDKELIEKIDKSGPGDKKDGKIGIEDFQVSEETGDNVIANYRELVDYILKGKNLEVSKKVLQSHLLLQAADSFNLGVGERAEDKQTTKVESTSN